MNVVKLDTLSLCRYEPRYTDFKNSFKNDSKSRFINSVTERLESSMYGEGFTFQSAYVVLDENIPVGYVYLSSVHDDEVFLEVSVLKEYRGKKLGKRITNEICDYLFTNHNIKSVKLDIDPSNKASLMNAESCGLEFDEDDFESRNFIGEMVFYKESDCYVSKREEVNNEACFLERCGF